MIFLRCYPSLYDVVHDLSGHEIYGLKIMHSFGFFAAIAFLTAVYILKKELHRREQLGFIKPGMIKLITGKGPDWTDTILPFLLGLFIGLKLPGFISNDPEMLADPQGFLISLKGNWILGLVFGGAWAVYEYWSLKKRAEKEPKQESLVPYYPSQQVGNMLIIAVIAGVLGAKLFYYLESPAAFVEFLHHPNFDIFSGLTIYGGLICASLSLLVFARIKNISVPHLFDSLAPAFFFGYAIGRIGCQVAGDGDWGIVNNLPNPGWIPQFLWSDVYANNILQTCDPYGGMSSLTIACNWNDTPYLVQGVFPTPIYETLMVSMLASIMWVLRKRLQYMPGMLVGLFFVFDGIERYLIEKIRVNPREFIGGRFTQAELIATIFIIIGVLMLILLPLYYKRKNQKTSTATDQNP